MLTNPGFWALFLILLFCIYALFIFIPDTWKGRIAVLVIGAICALVFSAMLYEVSQTQTNTWNNGIHIDCGGEYQFSSATNWRGSKNYYYTCDKCGHTEEFSSLMR